MKSLLLKSMSLVIAYFLAISAVLAISTDSSRASKDLQDAPIHDGYNSSYNNSSISFDAQSKIVQAPTTMSVGSGYYSAHPVKYGSAIGSQTWIKDGTSSVSMQHDISYAHGINGQLNAAASDTSHSINDVKFSSSATANMKVDETVTNGSVHIGVLQGSDNSGLNMDAIGGTDSGKDSSVEAWKKPAMEIDEDYIGTYHIYKNMTIKTSYHQYSRNESWLDLHNEAYIESFLPHPATINADNIFNCKIANPWKTLET